MLKVTAPLWIGIILGALIGGSAELWGIANLETLIRLARWKDRLFIGRVARRLGAGDHRVGHAGHGDVVLPVRRPG